MSSVNNRGRGSRDLHTTPAATPSAVVSRPPAPMEELIALCRSRGFIFPASDIYGGFASTYDYGHYGVLLRDKIRQSWWRSMVHDRNDILAFDSAILQHPQVWEASGHTKNFQDPMVDCKTCKHRFRTDHLDDSPCGQRPSKIAGQTSACDLTDSRSFNLMFQTEVGATGGQQAYLRPETAQGIFINFMNVLKSSRMTPPFGIAQTGKSFRNEITPGNFVFRTREFEQMEMEFFVPPADAATWYEYWRQHRYQWYMDMGIRPEHLRLRDHDQTELAHYATAVADIEYLFDKGWSELEGVAWRGDYDLRQHMKSSGKKLMVPANNGQEAYLPHVIEPASGLDRIMLALIADAYEQETLPDGSSRTVLHLHPRVAPITAAVLPLVGNNTHMTEIAQQITQRLTPLFNVEYDQGGNIGKRYRRQDEIGTPWCFTIDEQTEADNTVTVRDRDSMQQTRIAADELAGWLAAKMTA